MGRDPAQCDRYFTPTRQEEMMKPNAQIIAALEQLEAARATPENKEWLASRKEIGRQINPEAVAVTWQFGSVLDPYRLGKPVPEKLQLIGREYFARSLDEEEWVSFDDLPRRTSDRLWQRLRAGHFDSHDVELTPATAALVNFNRMLFRPEPDPPVRIEGRVACRTSRRSDALLIVKPSDPGSMIYQLVTLSQLPVAHIIGWMPARTAKRLCPLITVGSIAAHFVEQDELRADDELETFLQHSA
jgi:hypothetical protein